MLIELYVALANLTSLFGCNGWDLLPCLPIEPIIHEPLTDELLGELPLRLTPRKPFFVALAVEIA